MHRPIVLRVLSNVRIIVTRRRRPNLQEEERYLRGVTMSGLFPVTGLRRHLLFRLYHRVRVAPIGASVVPFTWRGDLLDHSYLRVEGAIFRLPLGRSHLVLHISNRE